MSNLEMLKLSASLNTSNLKRRWCSQHNCPFGYHNLSIDKPITDAWPYVNRIYSCLCWEV